MSLAGFQQALADCISSPALTVSVRGGSVGVLDAYDLTARERGRVERLVAQRGMDVCCTLYRGHRLTPLVRSLPRVVAALGPRLRPAVESHWQAHPDADLQFRAEAESFASSLRGWWVDEPDRVVLDGALALDLADLDRHYTQPAH